jgi:2-isopropylmalate synthase
MSRIYIFDTTLRDGEQAPGCSMTTMEKIQVASALVDLGVDILEAGFPIASEEEFEAVRLVGREFSTVQVAALSRASTVDVERAAKALAYAKRPRINIFIATSEIHLKYKLRKSEEQVLDEAVAAITLARRYMDDVQFCAEDATRTELNYLQKISLAAVEAGARTVELPDTVGYSTPDEYAEIIGRIVTALDDRALVSAHCHNDLGLAVANSLAALRAGARQVECTINGIGERAGNAAMEEIVVAMKTRHDRLPFETAINAEKLFQTSQVVTNVIEFGPPPNKAIVGENAFAHEAGIHQDGYLKAAITYQIIDPASVGVPKTRIVLGKHSGRHALKQRAWDLGYQLSVEQLDEVYRQFMSIADRKKGIHNNEIRRLIEELTAGDAIESPSRQQIPSGF